MDDLGSVLIAVASVVVFLGIMWALTLAKNSTEKTKDSPSPALLMYRQMRAMREQEYDIDLRRRMDDYSQINSHLAEATVDKPLDLTYSVRDEGRKFREV